MGSRATDWLQVFRSSYDDRWYWNRRTKDWRVAGTANQSFKSRDSAVRNARKANPGILVVKPPGRRTRPSSALRESKG